MAKSVKPQLELVKWRDANFEFEAKSLAELPDEYLVTTCGYVLSDSGKFLVIAAEALPEGQGWRAVSMIPHAMVLERKALTSKEAK